MSGSYYTLNNKYNQLLALLNSITGGGGGGVPTSSNLAVVLDNGNSAGAFDINMNNNDILQVDNINLITINGSAYPPTSSIATNLAGGIASQIPFQSAPNTTGFIANGTIGQYLKSNGTATPSWDTVIPATPTIAQVLTAGNDALNQSITNINDIDVTTINGSAYPPVVSVPTIDQVLNAGSISIAKQQTFTSGIDQIQVAIDNTQIVLEDLAVGGSALLARQQLYIESPITTSITHTEINQTSLICNTHDNILGGDNTTTLQGTSILMLATQPTLFTSQQLQFTPTDLIQITNGGVPVSASWASILAGGGATPNIQQVLVQGDNANGSQLIGLNNLLLNDNATGLSQGQLFFNNNNGSITGLQTINGSLYPPPSSSQNLNTTLSYGNNTGGYDIDFGNNSNINNLLNVNLQTVNGSPYPPYPTSPYGLQNVLSINNDAGGLNMTNIANINLSTINGSAYPPSPYYPDLNSVLNQGNSAYHDIDMTNQSILNCNNINTATINGTSFVGLKASYSFLSFNLGTLYSGSNFYGGGGVAIPSGTYQITYTIAWDGTMVSGGVDCCNCYCYLHSVSYGGDFYTNMRNNGYLSSFQITTLSSYPNYLTFTDTISLPYADTYYLGAGQNSSGGQYGGIFIGATLVLQ
jgi:hypothetical protein